MNILTISLVFPYPPDDGTKIQIFNRIKEMSVRNSVTLLCVVDQIPDTELIAKVTAFCTCHFIMRPPTRFSDGVVAKLRNFLRSLVGGAPYYDLDAFSLDAYAWIEQGVTDGRFDIVEADGSAGVYLRRRLAVPTVWIAHSISDANSRRADELAETALGRIVGRGYWWILRRYERNLAKRVNLVVTLTRDNEKELKALDDQLNVKNCLSNGVDLDYFNYEEPKDTVNGVCFVGKMDHIPNNDAALYFAQNIWPSVRRANPQAQFLVIGSSPLPAVQALANRENVTVTGYVVDVRLHMRFAGVAVVPMRMGGGILNKILEAMALGIPVVTRRVAIEGLSVTPGEQLLVYDDDEQFGDAINRLLSTRTLRCSLARAAREYVEVHHRWAAVVAKYEQELHTVWSISRSSLPR